MIAPINSGYFAEAQSGPSHVNDLDKKNLEAASTFNSFVFEKMLNIHTEAKYRTGEKSFVSKQIELMHNATLANQLAENNEQLNKKIAMEILR